MSGKPTYEELEQKNRELESLLFESKKLAAHFKCIFRAIPDAAVFADTDRRISAVNPSFIKKFGYEEKELFGRDTSIVYSSKADYEEQGKIRFNLTAEEKLKPYEVNYRKKNGDTFSAEVVAATVKDDDENTIGFLGILRDITVRDKKEKELLVSENRYRILFEESHDAIYISSRKGKFIDVNQAMLDLFDYTLEEMVGMNILEIYLNPFARKTFQQEIEDKKSVKDYEIRFVRKDGTVIDCLVTATLRQAGNGTVLGYQGIIRDVSDDKRLDNQLLLAKKEWEETFDTINDSITIHDKDFNIIRCNRAAEKMLGLPLQDILKQKCYTSYHGTGCPPDGCPSCKSLKTGEPAVSEFFDPYLGKYVEIKALPRFDKNRQVVGLVHVVRDVSERKQIEEEKKELEAHLQQTYKMETIGTLAGGIAHDFNNVLGIIRGYADLALDYTSEVGPAKSYINKILIASKRARELVKQILLFSRQETQNIVPLQPGPIIKESINLLRSTIPSTIKIQQNIASQCGIINADPTQIHQVLINLLTNAMHAMNEKGTLKVTLQEINLTTKALEHKPGLLPGTYICLSVSDKGGGIEKKAVDRIFDPFYTTKKAGEGTGLGLAVVHGIVESHGGMITVDSSLGKGTTFNVFFPVVESEVERVSEKSESLPTGSERILFIDDEVDMAEIGGTVLGLLGYKVTILTSSVDALEAFISGPDEFDLVITDQTMPDMSGTELAVELLKIRPDIPIILCTGYSRIVSDEMIKEIGIRKFLMKPLENRDLAIIVRKILDEKA